MSQLQFEISRWRAALLVDGSMLDNGYVLDFRELAKSALTGGECWFFTCGCGEPGCAGISAPTEVTFDGDRVRWRLIQPEPERRFTFRRVQYHQAIQEALAAILRIETNRKGDSRFGPHGFSRHTFQKLHASMQSSTLREELK